jgi:nucleoside-diphosphate-sugar epimerase
VSAGFALVTGASGFLGGRLAELLVARGERVRVLLRAASRVDHLPRTPLLEVVRADLTPGRALREAVEGARVVYHCAGCSTDWASAGTYTAGNLAATEAMLQAAAGCERFVHVSTTDVYGYPATPCAESGALTRVGLPYNETKIQGEQAVWRAAAAGLPCTVVRPASIYGPRGSAFVTDVVANLRTRTMLLVDGGRACGGLVYVDDVCELLLLAARSPRAAGEAYNAASTDGVTWRDYCAQLAGELGLPAPWLQLPFTAAMALAHAMEWPYGALGWRGRPLLTQHAVFLLGRDQGFPVAKATAELGWQPRTSLAEGARRAAEWVRAAAETT